MVDISELSSHIKGDVVIPSDADYAKAIARWAVNAERKALVVVFVKDQDDVILAIKFAKANGLSIAIRGGGHSPAGASSVEGGLVIDLSRHMNNVRVNAEEKLAYVGGGALWEAVDKAAIEHGLATVGGTVNHTGVGGLLLGGGYGWLSGAHGLVIDNLVQATIITADGSVVIASETKNPDLFFGIRGGGCNFGVATEFVLTLHPQRRTVYAGSLIFEGTALEKIIQYTQAWWPKAGPDEGMLQMLTAGPDGTPVIMLNVFFNGSADEGRANFKDLLQLGPIADMTEEMPYENLNNFKNANFAHGNGVYIKGTAHNKPDYTSVSIAHQKAIEVTKLGEMQTIIMFEYLPCRKINAVDKKATAFRRETEATNVLAVLIWPGDGVDKSTQAREVAYSLAEILDRGQANLTQSERMGYSNYDIEVLNGEKAKLVFGENYPRLQKIKGKYDPQNIFNKWFPITPASPARN